MKEIASKKISLLIDEIEKVILGKREIIQLTVVAFLSGGHVLFEDIPGVGKTALVKTFAKATHGTYSRIQFTPDLLPNDILGVSIYNNVSRAFEFQAGPIFTTVLLADEINRATPRTQSALLEAMSENHVTIDNHTYELNENFFVLATQNPLDYEGTFPLPEAQLDRFLFRLHIGYPDFTDELNLLLSHKKDALEHVQQVLTTADIRQLKELAQEIYIDPQVARYALQLVYATREDKQLLAGISPRGALSFVKAAKAFALTEGRTFVTPQDLQYILPATFTHRLLLREGASNATTEIHTILEKIIRRTPVPVRKS